MPEGSQAAFREEITPESPIRPENHGNLSIGRTNMFSPCLHHYGQREGSTDAATLRDEAQAVKIETLDPRASLLLGSTPHQNSI